MGAAESDTEVFLATPSPGSDTVVVVFSAAAAKPGKFHLQPLVDHLPGFSKLYVRDPRVGWYNAGLPGVGETLAEIATGIERQASELGATRIVTTGPSVGAYASILFGCLVGADHVIALAPQTVLDRRLRHAPPEEVAVQAADLRPVIAAAPGTRIDLVAGWYDHIDVFHARRVAGQPSVRLLAVPYRLHKFGMPFSHEDRTAFLAETIAGGTPAVCTADPELDPETERLVAEVAYAEPRGDWSAVADSARAILRRHPQWGGPRFDLARALLELGDHSGAEQVLSDLVRAEPEWIQPRERLASLRGEDGRPAEADSAGASAR